MYKLFIKYRPVYLMLIILGISVDQITKTYLIYALPEYFEYSINALPFLKIVYAWNYGISFGLFSNYYQYSNYAFIAINLSITGYLIYLLGYSSEYNKYALSLVVSGAIGNLIDRVLRGAVFDFIFLHYDTYSFPAFNIADSLISLGALLFLIDFYWQRK